MDTNGWSKAEMFVLKELEEHKKEIKTLNEKIDKVLVAIADLKAKSGIWGIIGGSIPVLIGVLIYLLTK